MILTSVALLVLHPKKELAEPLVANEDTHQILSLPLMNEEAETNWHARQSQQIAASSEQILTAEPQQLTPESTPVVEPERAKESGLSRELAPPPILEPIQTSHTPSKKMVAHPSIVLQVASYSSFKNAQVMRNQLDSLGYIPHIQTVRINNKNWYRLSAGPFKDTNQAKLAQQAIEKKWRLKPKILLVQ